MCDAWHTRVLRVDAMVSVKEHHPTGKTDMQFYKARHQVANRGIPPRGFLAELVAWGKIASDDIFLPSVNHRDDVYVAVAGALGPWKGPRHMRAVMLEVLSVLAGYESSWDWNQGTDTDADKDAAKHHRIRNPIEIEAGAWQVSANSMNLAPELKNLVFKRVKSLSAHDFQEAMKRDHQLAMEYIARLLRRTISQNGPVARHTIEIDKWLRHDAVAEFQALLFPIQPQNDGLPRFPL
jgi:hypothetical protein